MKAAYINKTGSPDVIQVGDLPPAVPGSGEVRVQIKVAGLNPIDVYIRAGTVAMPLPRPFIPGSDLAGIVTAVGPNVSRFKIGDRVWGSNQGLLGRQGTSAEFAIVSEDYLYPIPAGVTDQQAAAIALVGITAHLGLFQYARLQPGEIVFVNGGTGGVGSAVVLMARAIGARVITTVGSEQKADLARSWGADLVLNYRTDDISARIKEFTSGKGVNVWYETQREPDLLRTVDLMSPRGRIVLIAGRTAQSVLPVGPFYVKGLSLFGFAMFNATPVEQRQCAEDINRWLAAGQLNIPVGRIFPLVEAAAAHQLLEENTLGKKGSLIGKVLLVP